MTLFAILGILLFTLIVLFFYNQGRNPGGSLASILQRNPSEIFFKGMLHFVPVLILLLFFKRAVPLSFKPFNFYLFYTVRDHLLPFLIALAGCFFFLRKKDFLELLFFLSGFYSLQALTGVIMNYGHYEMYILFLLPAIRMSVMLYFVLLFLRYLEWYGIVKIIFLFVLFLIPFAGGAITYLYMRFFTGTAFLLAALFLSGSLIFLLIEQR